MEEKPKKKKKKVEKIKSKKPESEERSDSFLKTVDVGGRSAFYMYIRCVSVKVW